MRSSTDARIIPSLRQVYNSGMGDDACGTEAYNASALKCPPVSLDKDGNKNQLLPSITLLVNTLGIMDN